MSAIIAAAGGGVRMGGVCKPLLRLGNTSVFERVLKVFTDSALIDEVICVCGGDERFEDIVSRPWNGKPVRIVQGGSERHISVYNGIAATDPSLLMNTDTDTEKSFVEQDGLGVTRSMMDYYAVSMAVMMKFRWPTTIQAVLTPVR